MTLILTMGRLMPHRPIQTVDFIIYTYTCMDRDEQILQVAFQSLRRFAEVLLGW